MASRINILALVAGLISSTLAGNGVHLANCARYGGGITSSEVIYCADDSNCGTYNYDDTCLTGGTPQQWEQGGSCTFPTGVTFSWGLAADSQSHATYSAVGGGSNGDQHFTCYKDDQHGMQTQNGIHCSSIYYCI